MPFPAPQPEQPPRAARAARGRSYCVAVRHLVTTVVFVAVGLLLCDYGRQVRDGLRLQRAVAAGAREAQQAQASAYSVARVVQQELASRGGPAAGVFVNVAGRASRSPAWFTAGDQIDIRVQVASRDPGWPARWLSASTGLHATRSITVPDSPGSR